MASKSLDVDPISKPLTSKTNSYCYVARFTLAFAISVMVFALSSCSQPATKMPSTDTPTPLRTPTSRLSSTPSQSATPTVSPTAILTPTSTPTPFGTLISGSFISYGNSIFEPVEFPATIGAAMETLPSGMYIIGADIDSTASIEEFNYASLETSQQGLLLSVGEIIDLRNIFFNAGETRVFGGFGSWTTKYLFDLSNKGAFQFSICPPAEGGIPSPTGRWLAITCGEANEEGKIIFQIISLIDGSVLQLEVSGHSDSPYKPCTVDWIDDDSFIFLLPPEDIPCLISIPDLGMRCVPSLKDKTILKTSRDWFIVKGRSHAWIADIFPMACFYDPQECKPAYTFDSDEISFTHFKISPDGTMIALDSGDRSSNTSSAKIGYYDTETWTYHKIGVFARDYGLFTWCPDSSCMLIAGEPSYLAYLDGHMERFTIHSEYLIDLIQVP